MIWKQLLERMQPNCRHYRKKLQDRRVYSRKLLQQQIEETAVQVEVHQVAAVQIAVAHQVAAVQVELVLHREHLLHQAVVADLAIRVRQLTSVVSSVDVHPVSYTHLDTSGGGRKRRE